MRSHSNPAVDDAPCRKTNNASSSGWLQHGTTINPTPPPPHCTAPHCTATRTAVCQAASPRVVPHDSWHSLLIFFQQSWRCNIQKS